MTQAELGVPHKSVDRLLFNGKRYRGADALPFRDLADMTGASRPFNDFPVLFACLHRIASVPQ
jgi:hypothetical protein